jgi:hypothetical protein
METGLKMTDYLAVYAAVLSTLVFLWNVLQSRPRIKVDLISGIEGSGDSVTSGIYVFVRNLSSYDIHLSNIDILYPYTNIRTQSQPVSSVSRTPGDSNVSQRDWAGCIRVCRITPSQPDAPFVWRRDNPTKCSSHRQV